MKHRKTTKKARSISRKTAFNVPISNNLSDIEDNEKALQIIGRLTRSAGNNAAAEAKAAGLTRTYVRGDRDLVKVSADGAIMSIPATVQKPFYIKYKPATILHAIKR
jgi:hypothetical protein